MEVEHNLLLQLHFLVLGLSLAEGRACEERSGEGCVEATRTFKITSTFRLLTLRTLALTHVPLCAAGGKNGSE